MMQRENSEFLRLPKSESPAVTCHAAFLHAFFPPCRAQKKTKTFQKGWVLKISLLMVEPPTHLKNMRKSNWIISPSANMKILKLQTTSFEALNLAICEKIILLKAMGNHLQIGHGKLPNMESKPMVELSWCILT